jgi:two-component system phosphate regulon sensor histidine kinase PhoR
MSDRPSSHEDRSTSHRPLLVAQAVGLCVIGGVALATIEYRPAVWAIIILLTVLLALIAWGLWAPRGTTSTSHHSPEDCGLHGEEHRQAPTLQHTNGVPVELEGILRAMQTGVITLSNDGRVVNMNPSASELLDLDPHGSVGRFADDIGLDELLCARVAAVLEKRETVTSELVLEAGGGRRIVVHIEPLHDAHATFSGVIIMFDDVTQLRRLEQMRSDFAANVSHELRTPITSIQGYAELLAGELDSEPLHGYAQIIERSVRRLSAIIDDLLSLSRLESPDSCQLPDRSVFSICEMFEDVVRSCIDEATTRHILLEIECSPQLMCDGVRRLIEQAVGNLVVNAIRYGPTTSTVGLRAVVDEAGTTEILVTDQGPGIATEHQDRIFERFYRIDRGRSREVGGTGLGLAIVKHIARVHGGQVDVCSGTGDGTRFRITLPRAD